VDPSLYGDGGYDQFIIKHNLAELALKNIELVRLSAEMEREYLSLKNESQLIKSDLKLCLEREDYLYLRHFQFVKEQKAERLAIN